MLAPLWATVAGSGFLLRNGSVTAGRNAGRLDKRYEGMKDLSLSNKTIRGLHAMLRQCLDQAVQERLIPYNPAAGCRRFHMDVLCSSGVPVYTFEISTSPVDGAGDGCAGKGGVTV